MSLAHDPAISVPPGFKALPIAEGFIGHNGPYYRKKLADGSIVFGFQADARHTNPNGVVHGGAILGFLDTILGNMVWRETRRRCATISLESRFLSPAPAQAWITGHVVVRRLSKSLAFLDAEARAGDTVVVAATAIFRIFD